MMEPEQKSGDTAAQMSGEGVLQSAGAVSWRQQLADLPLWLIIAGFLAVVVLGLNEKLMYSPDCARYIFWAKSLASFEGFVDTSGPEPLRYVIHAPFYPILLAPLAWIFTDLVIPAKVLTLLCGVALLILFFVWTSRATGKGGALLGTLFLALNSLTILFSGQVLSDIPFAACAVIAFLLVAKMSEHPDDDRWAWGLAAVLTVGVFLREIGLSLLISAVVYLILTKQYRRLLLVFTIPMLFYLLWYFRNEVYYGGLENPNIRNTRLFTGRHFTAESESMLKEFMTRIESNSSVYGRWAKGLILFPQFASQSYAGVPIPVPLRQSLNGILLAAQVPLILLQYGLFAWGAVVAWRRNKTTAWILIFCCIYMAVVLLYPVNDLRFLVPMMVLMLHFCVVGGGDLVRRLSPRIRKNRVAGALGGLLLLVLAVPNTVWVIGYIEGNKGYLRERSDPTRKVAQWIAAHSDPSTTVMSRLGEVALWLDGRKLIMTDRLQSLSLFDSYIRDYNATYIVASVFEPGLRDYEFQMLQTRKYSLTPVFRAGKLEVIHVEKATGNRPGGLRAAAVDSLKGGEVIAQREVDARNMFARGVKELDAGRPNDALKYFSDLLGSSGSGYVGLFCGISLEIDGQYEAALRLYRQLRNQLQAGPYIFHAQYHESLLRNLEIARESSSPTERAAITHRVSAVYWDLGFRLFAVKLLEQSLREDPTFAPSLVFGMYYSLQSGDTLGARRYFYGMKSTNPTHAIMATLETSFWAMDSARNARGLNERLAYRLRLAKSYAQLGLVDGTIDESISILGQDSTQVGALQLLAEAYDLKGRIAPAVRVLERLVTITPDDAIAREKLQRLSKRM